MAKKKTINYRKRVKPSEEFTKMITTLFKIKSIITLVCLGLFVYLTIVGRLEIAIVVSIISNVLTYFFNKKDGENNSDNNV